jgi:hypothetical protein
MNQAATQNSDRTRERHYVRFNPDDFQRFIELVNCLPTDAPVQSEQEAIAEFGENVIEKFCSQKAASGGKRGRTFREWDRVAQRKKTPSSRGKITSALRRRVRKAVKSLLAQLQFPSGPHQELDLPALYQLGIAIKRTLAALVEKAGELASEEYQGASLVDLPPTFGRFLVVNESNRVELSLDRFQDEFLPALKGADITRIRRCVSCGLFLYARHSQKVACSENCANANRVRRFRARRPEYEKNRARNRVARLAKEARLKSKTHSHRASKK